MEPFFEVIIIFIFYSILFFTLSLYLLTIFHLIFQSYNFFISVQVNQKKRKSLVGFDPQSHRAGQSSCLSLCHSSHSATSKHLKVQEAFKRPAQNIRQFLPILQDKNRSRRWRRLK